MSDRCEPPPELRERDGWHWVERDGQEPQLLEWQHEGIWLRVPPVYAASRPPHAAYLGFRYLSPVHTPAEVGALRAEAYRAGAEAMRANGELLQDKATRDTLSWCLNWLNVHKEPSRTLADAEAAIRSRRDALQRDIDEHRSAIRALPQPAAPEDTP